jgi:zinc protease
MRHLAQHPFRLSVLIFAFAFFNVATHAQTTTDRLTNLFHATESTLPNGLRLLIREDHKCPMVAVQVWYRVGSVDEPAGRYGFAHLFEHMMFRGTDRLGPSGHMDLIKSVGGTCNAFTFFDETCYHQTLPAHQLELALWLESERMAFLTIDTAGFTTERKVVEEEYRMNLNQPYGDLVDKAPVALLGTHPYAHSPLGSIKDLRLATPSEAHAWWTKWYVPNNATLVIVGDVDPAATRSLVQQYFGWIPRVPPESARNIPLVTPWEHPKQIKFELENAPVPAVGLVWPTVPEGHPDALPLELLATVLGGGESSRVYQHLVTDKHLAVMAAALRQSFAHGGGFGVGALLSPIGSNHERTLAALRIELEQIQKEGVTSAELEKARNQAVSAMLYEANTVEGTASLIGRAVAVGAGLDELTTRAARLRALTRDDLQRVATQYLDLSRAATVTVPASGLWQQVTKLFAPAAAAKELPEPPATHLRDNTVLRGRAGVVRPPGLPVQPPINRENQPLPKFEVDEHRLTNGLRLLIAPKSGASLVQIVLGLPYGAWSEKLPGTADFATRLAAKATRKHDAKSLAEELERHGIRLTAAADEDDCRIEVTCLADHADQAMALLAEVAIDPAFPEPVFKIIQNQVLTDLTMQESTPSSIADRQFRRALFKDHPYNRQVSGEPADVRRLRPADLLSFWKQMARPDRATLTIAGALNAQQSLALAERCFSSWKSSGNFAPAPPQPPTAEQLDSAHILLVNWPGAAQSEIRVGGLGITGNDADKPFASLVGSYFGGAFGSRLMKAIRIEKGATYGASGGFVPRRFGGNFHVSTFTKTSSTADTLRLVLSEIQALKTRPAADDELSLHKRYFLGNAVSRYETPQRLAEQLTRISLNGWPLDYVQRTLQTINSATTAQCDSLVRRVVNPEQLVIIIVGDAAAIAKDLAEIRPVTIIDHDGRPAHN